MLSDTGFTALIPINEVAPSEQFRIRLFSCGTPSLDAFLIDHAKDQHEDHLGHTSVLFHEDFEGMVGYITLSNDAIPLKTSEVGNLGLAYEVKLSAFPAVKIGRMAVHEELQRLGIGQRILDLATGELVGTPTVTTARLLITDAVNDPRVISFYMKARFFESYWAIDQAKNHGKGMERATIKMIRDIYA